MIVFADTSALYGLLDRGDAHHCAAAAEWGRLIDGPHELLTTNYVLLETVFLLHRRLGLDGTRAFAEGILPLLQVHWVAQATHNAAFAALLAAEGRALSMVDRVSFAVMRALGLTMAFTMDRDFAKQGFSVLPTPE